MQGVRGSGYDPKGTKYKAELEKIHQLLLKQTCYLSELVQLTGLLPTTIDKMIEAYPCYYTDSGRIALYGHYYPHIEVEQIATMQRLIINNGERVQNITFKQAQTMFKVDYRTINKHIESGEPLCGYTVDKEIRYADE